MSETENGIEYLTEKEAADVLRCSAHIIKHWRKSGYGPPFFKIGTMVRYGTKELREWILSKRYENLDALRRETNE